MRAHRLALKLFTAAFVIVAASATVFALSSAPADATTPPAIQTTIGEPPSCKAAEAFQSAGRVDQAIVAYVRALASTTSQACAIAGLTVLLPGISSVPGTVIEQQACNQASALLAADQLDDAQKLYAGLLMTSPGLACAKDGLLTLGKHRVAVDCLVGQKLLDAHQYNLAVAQFQAAVSTAGSAKAAMCGSDGLLQVQAAQDNLSPRVWNDWQNRIVQVGIGVLWGLAGLVLAVLLILLKLGWAVRVINWIRPRQLRPRLVPRVRLAPITGKEGDVGPDSFTPLLRTQMLKVQSSNRVNLDFVSSSSNVQGLVTAVKDIDAKLGAWAQLAMAFNWVWPWKTLIVQGQILPAGRNGAGITLSIATGARVPAVVTFWRKPNSPAAVAIAQPVSQDYYDLIPAAATWAVYESARVSRTDSEVLRSSDAISSGYLAAFYALVSADPEGAMSFLTAANSTDPDNAGVRLALIQREPNDANDKCDDYFSLLVSKWLKPLDALKLPKRPPRTIRLNPPKSPQPPDLSVEIWGVPHG